MVIYGYTKIILNNKGNVNVDVCNYTCLFTTEEERDQTLINDYNSNVNVENDEYYIEDVTRSYYSLDRYYEEIIFDCFEEIL